MNIFLFIWVFLIGLFSGALLVMETMVKKALDGWEETMELTQKAIELVEELMSKLKENGNNITTKN